MKAYIVLRCDGRMDNNFNFCSGVRNIILDLEEVEKTSGYLEIIKYLNRVPKIFDGPCFKSHIISNAIYKMYQMGYINDDVYRNIAHFYDLHKRCGLILEAELKDDFISV